MAKQKKKTKTKYRIIKLTQKEYDLLQTFLRVQFISYEFPELISGVNKIIGLNKKMGLKK